MLFELLMVLITSIFFHVHSLYFGSKISISLWKHVCLPPERLSIKEENVLKYVGKLSQWYELLNESFMRKKEYLTNWKYYVLFQFYISIVIYAELFMTSAMQILIGRTVDQTAKGICSISIKLKFTFPSQWKYPES